MFYLEIDEILDWIDEHYKYNTRMANVRKSLERLCNLHDCTNIICNCPESVIISRIVDGIYAAGWNDARSEDYLEIPKDECPNCYPKTLKSGDCEGPPNCLQ